MKYDPAAYYHYTTPSGKLGMERYGRFTRDKAMWLKFWGIDAEQLTEDIMRFQYGATRDGIFTLAEETTTQIIQL